MSDPTCSSGAQIQRTDITVLHNFEWCYGQNESEKGEEVEIYGDNSVADNGNVVDDIESSGGFNKGMHWL